MTNAQTQNWILIGQSFLFFFQTILLGYYARETKKIRQEANNQNASMTKQIEGLDDQLAVMREQTDLIRQQFQRQVARDRLHARPFLVWGGGTGRNGSDDRTIEFTNQGGAIQLIEWRYNYAEIDIRSQSFIDHDAHGQLIVSGANGNVFFGIRYETQYGDIEETLYEITHGDRAPHIWKNPGSYATLPNSKHPKL